MTEILNIPEQLLIIVSYIFINIFELSTNEQSADIALYVYILTIICLLQSVIVITLFKSPPWCIP